MFFCLFSAALIFHMWNSEALTFLLSAINFISCFCHFWLDLVCKLDEAGWRLHAVGWGKHTKARIILYSLVHWKDEWFFVRNFLCFLVYIVNEKNTGAIRLLQCAALPDRQDESIELFLAWICVKKKYYARSIMKTWIIYADQSHWGARRTSHGPRFICTNVETMHLDKFSIVSKVVCSPASIENR
jgi:hypothetical protein